MSQETDKEKSSAQRLAEAFIKRSGLFIAGIALLTVFFAYGWTKVAVRTVFSDFVPSNDPITDTFRKHINFGNPLLVQILIKAKHGSIFTPEGLAKVYRLTQAVDLIPGVDHEHVISIASPKIRMNRATPTGVDSLPVMEDNAPANQGEADEVRRRARNALAVYGILVSPDESAALLEVGFHEDTVDYDTAFQRVNELIAKENNGNYQALAAGRVMLTGWVYLYGRRAFWIFVASLLIIAVMHVDYMRSFTGAATPLISAAVATIWGVGLAGWMGLNVDPMTLVIPVLLTARGRGPRTARTVGSGDQNVNAVRAPRDSRTTKEMASHRLQSLSV